MLKENEAAEFTLLVWQLYRLYKQRETLYSKYTCAVIQQQRLAIEAQNAARGLLPTPDVCRRNDEPLLEDVQVYAAALQATDEMIHCLDEQFEDSYIAKLLHLLEEKGYEPLNAEFQAVVERNAQLIGDKK